MQTLVLNFYMTSLGISFIFTLFHYFVLKIKWSHPTMMILGPNFCVGVASNLFTLYHNCFPNNLRDFRIPLFLATPYAKVFPNIMKKTARNRPIGVSNSRIFLFHSTSSGCGGGFCFSANSSRRKLLEDHITHIS